MFTKRFIYLGIIFLSLILTGCGGVDNPTPEPTPTNTPEPVLSLTFGVYTADKPSEVVLQFRPILDALEKHMSNNLEKPVEIKVQVAPTYEDGIADISQGNVDFSRFGPASYIEARKANPDLQLLAMESEKGEKVFYGIIAVHADSAIQSVNDLQGKTFAFGDELSTIGRFLSQLYLYQHGITASDLAQYDYLERHDAVGAAVGAKEYDAGALKESTFKKLVDNDVPIRELARFPNVTKPWFAHESMTGEVFEALHQALLSMDEPAALEALGKDGFLESSDADYAVIQEAIENNDLFFENE